MSDQADKVVLYISSGCGPCGEVKRMIEEGRFNLERPPELIDVTLEENQHFIIDLALQKVPTAMKGKNVCEILSDGESLMFKCPGDTNPPAEEIEEE